MRVLSDELGPLYLRTSWKGWHLQLSTLLPMSRCLSCLSISSQTTADYRADFSLQPSLILVCFQMFHLSWFVWKMTQDRKRYLHHLSPCRQSPVVRVPAYLNELYIPHCIFAKRAKALNHTFHCNTNLNLIFYRAWAPWTLGIAHSQVLTRTMSIHIHFSWP